jgi:hypothetical protein
VGDDEELVWVGEAGLIAARFGGDGRLREKYFFTAQSAGPACATSFASSGGRRQAAEQLVGQVGG